MSKSNQFIHVNGMREAWSTAYDLARDVLHGLGVSLVHFAYDADASKAAGYAIYRAAPDCDGLPVMLHYNYICDLGDALELNTCRGDWSGVVYRIVYAGAAAAPAAVADGDGLQGSGVNSAEGSAAAGAIPAGSSDNGAGDPDLVTLRLRRLDVCQVSLALLGVKWDFINEARGLPVDDTRRGVCISSARMWDALHKEVRRQLQEHDARRGCGVDPWEVA